MVNKQNGAESKKTNEKPVSLNPVGFEDALRGLLTIPPSDEPKAEEKTQSAKKGRARPKN